MKNLLIGAADLYTWKQIAPWIISFREHNKIDDIVLICYRVDTSIIDNAPKYNVKLLQASYDDWGRQIEFNVKNRNTVVHQLRFFHKWQFLVDNSYTYQYVISTDTRDVIFQSDPFVYLSHLQEVREKNGDDLMLVASSEGIRYQDEVWGLDNLLNGYGPYITEKSKHWNVYNVGVIAGKSEYCKSLFLTLYSMGIGRYIPNDQSSYAILVNDTMAPMFTLQGHSHPWACQCATTLDPEKTHYASKLTEIQPIIIDDKFYTNDGNLFTLSHQWDRTILKEIIEKKYENL